MRFTGARPRGSVSFWPDADLAVVVLEAYSCRIAQLERVALRTPPAKPTRLDADELLAIRTTHPAVPEDYLAFLRDVGFGGIGGQPEAPLFMLYSAPVPPSDIYAEEAAPLDKHYLLFGDDLSGNAAAFDRDGRVVSIFHEDLLVVTAAQSFSLFVAQLGREEN